MIRVFLADDHPLVREGLHRIVRTDSGFRVVGEAADADTLLAELAATEVDVLLLDISMPGPGFLELMRQIRVRFPGVRVLVVSMHPEGLYAEGALRAGAAGYVSKRQSVDELAHAIRQIHRGATYVSRTTPPSADDGADPSARRVQPLSPREFDILVRIARGHGITQIANDLGLSPKTVSTYRLRLLQKLGLESNAQLVRYVIENQLIS